MQKFIGIINDGNGDWRSLRCLAGMAADEKRRGLQMQPIDLNSKK